MSTLPPHIANSRTALQHQHEDQQQQQQQQQWGGAAQRKAGRGRRAVTGDSRAGQCRAGSGARTARQGKARQGQARREASQPSSATKTGHKKQQQRSGQRRRRRRSASHHEPRQWRGGGGVSRAPGARRRRVGARVRGACQRLVPAVFCVDRAPGKVDRRRVGVRLRHRGHGGTEVPDHGRRPGAGASGIRGTARPRRVQRALQAQRARAARAGHFLLPGHAPVHHCAHRRGCPVLRQAPELGARVQRDARPRRHQCYGLL